MKLIDALHCSQKTQKSNIVGFKNKQIENCLFIFTIPYLSFVVQQLKFFPAFVICSLHPIRQFSQKILLFRNLIFLKPAFASNQLCITTFLFTSKQSFFQFLVLSSSGHLEYPFVSNLIKHMLRSAKRIQTFDVT